VWAIWVTFSRFPASMESTSLLRWVTSSFASSFRPVSLERRCLKFSSFFVLVSSLSVRSLILSFFFKRVSMCERHSRQNRALIALTEILDSCSSHSSSICHRVEILLYMREERLWTKRSQRSSWMDFSIISEGYLLIGRPRNFYKYKY
jgi:hypothetical protein